MCPLPCREICSIFYVAVGTRNGTASRGNSLLRTGAVPVGAPVVDGHVIYAGTGEHGETCAMLSAVSSKLAAIIETRVGIVIVGMPMGGGGGTAPAMTATHGNMAQLGSALAAPASSTEDSGDHVSVEGVLSPTRPLALMTAREPRRTSRQGRAWRERARR
jgi:hypothetical protein